MRAFATLVIVIVVVIAIGVGIEVGVSPPRIKGPFETFGSFAGYSLSGNVTSLSAEWQVPTVAARSPGGEAATWIGVQDDAGDRFIQVGTLEATPASLTDGHKYVIFWSGLEENFEPQLIPGPVTGGDDVEISMRSIPGGWLLSIDDLSRRWHTSFATATDPQSGYDLAEWFQEDPTKLGGNGEPEPYPALSTVRFQRLRVDGQQPRLSIDDAQWMSERGQILAPTPMENGAFTVRPQLLTRPQQQYLAAIVPVNEAKDSLGNEEQGWGSATVKMTAMKQARRYAKVVEQFDQTIESESWPSSALGPLRTFRTAVDRTAKDAESLAAARSPTRQRQQEEAGYVEATLADAFALSLRSILGLPPPS